MHPIDMDIKCQSLNFKEFNMKNRYFRLINISLILTALALAPYAAAGDDESEEEKTSKKQTTQAQQVEPMTVVDKPISIRQDLDPSSITNIYRIEKSAQFGTEVFNREDITNLQPSDIFDLLDKATGINLTYQGRRSPFGISQRGGGSFTYIIDGAVLPPSVNRIIYKLPVAAIEEMQIVRGSTSLSLGPSIPIGASGSGSGLNTGYIIIRTKQPQKTQAILTGSVEKSVGDHPAATAESLYLGTRIGDEGAINGYAGILGAKMDRRSDDSWFDGRGGEGGMFNGGLNFGKLSINVMAYKDSGYNEMQRGIDFNGVLSNVKWYYDPLKAEIFSSDMAMNWTSDQVTLLNIFQTNYDQHENNASFISTDISYRDYEEETKGIGLRHNARFGNTLFQAGGQISKSTGFGPNLSSGYNRYDTTIKGWSLSLEQTLLDGNLSFDGGYREDTKHIDNSSTRATNDAANNDVDMAPSKVFALGAHWQIAENYTFDGRYYRGEQGTVGDFDMRLTGDATPHPEKQDRIEASIAADFASFFKPAVTWFSIETENQKSAGSTTYTIDGMTSYFYSESDTLRKGLEFMIQGNILKNTNYKITWTRMLDNESVSNGVTTDANGISQPENLYSIILSQRWNEYRANLSIKKVDEWQNSSSPMGTAQYGGLGDYTRIDANIKRDFKFSNFVLNTTLFGRNLGNEHYATRYVTGYYPDRGRTIGIELSFAY
ncbi:MAG: TonB-dependent receptor plug domain-containing protein [Deltaproteobacteria bacterium]|nr:TonB-dependent receptor plug domain-containing protein [Deltaproteobacteria bacterium]